MSLAPTAAPHDAPDRLRSSGPHESVERILDAVLEAISRRGARKFSMTDVSDAAGLSRGTLYRYFPTKELLLEAVFERGARRVEQEMQAAIAAAPGVEDRVRVVSEFRPGALDRELGARLMEAEPGFVLQFLARHLPHHRAVIEAALAPVFERAERRGARIDRTRIADLVVRTKMSLYLLPADDPSYNPATTLGELLDAMLAAEG